KYPRVEILTCDDDHSTPRLASCKTLRMGLPPAPNAKNTVPTTPQARVYRILRSRSNSSTRPRRNQMANFTYRAAPSKYRCGNEYSNLTVVLFFGPSSPTVPLACAYCCGMNVDSDGDPQSYGPLNTPRITPLDYLENAGWVPRDRTPDKTKNEPDDFKHRGNNQRKAAYDTGIAAARTEYEDLQKQRLDLEPKRVEDRGKELDKKIVDADKALNDLKAQKATTPQKIADAEKA